MTQSEFLQSLSESHEKWILHNRNGRKVIRTRSCQCPIEAVQQVEGKYVTHLMAHNLRLNVGLAEKIITTADDWKDDRLFDPELRKALLQAVGLEDFS